MAKEWERLVGSGESARQYKAFECYLGIDPRNRSLPNAWKEFAKVDEKATGDIPSGAFRNWAAEYCWKERAAAYDDHIASVRRKAHEKGIQKEAEKSGIDVERQRTQLADNFENITNTINKYLGGETDFHGDVTLAGISSMLRIQLEIAKYLRETSEPSESRDPVDALSEEDIVERYAAEIRAIEEEKGS